ncbi:MAG: hypothetical protein OXM02_01095 [Bacteroidota bacterium]|nr:hypothetical protein [Bacteroidota bacterium]MDE2833101.1 hypothetical protein [Bacteroidota bacterium]
MKRLGWPKREAAYVDTPKGIFTDAGYWYRTRESMLINYAEEVFERETLGCLLAKSDSWLRSPETLALWLLPALLIAAGPIQAVLTTLGFYLVWKIVSPAVVSRRLLPLVRLLETVLLQALWYVWVMVEAARAGQYVVLAIGLSGFIVIRWGILSYLMRPVIKWLWQSMYRMPVADHVLRAFIIRSALRHGITLRDFADTERQIAEYLSRK